MQPVFVSTCLACRRPMVKGKAPGPTPPGHVRHCGRGLCGSCYNRNRRTGDPAPAAAPSGCPVTVWTPAKHRCAAEVTDGWLCAHHAGERERLVAA